MQSFAAEQPEESRATVILTAGSGARMVATPQRAPGTAPWVLVKSDDPTSSVTLILSVSQAASLCEALSVVLASFQVTGEAA